MVNILAIIGGIILGLIFVAAAFIPFLMMAGDDEIVFPQDAELEKLKADTKNKYVELKDLKLQFIIDHKIQSKVYNLQHIIDKSIDEVTILEDMEVCDCSLNESSSHCEGDCLKYEHSKITGVVIVKADTNKTKDE